MKYKILYTQTILLTFIISCKGKKKYQNENWEDGSLKQIVETKEIRTHDQKKLIERIYCVKYFQKGERDSINFFKTEEYYDNGQLSRIENFRENKLNGKAEGWYKSGTKALDAYYINGKLHGEYKSWFPDGKVLEHIEYNIDSVLKK